MDDLICLDAVIDIARGTRRRDVRRDSHGVSRGTVLKRLRFWMQAGAFGAVMDLLALRGVRAETRGGCGWGGALDLSRVSVGSRSIRARKGGRAPAPTRQTDASPA